MIDNVWLVKPESYIHSLGLEHVARGFAEALGVPLIIGEQTNGHPIVFCGHLIARATKHMTIYNAEQISDQWLKEHPVYLQVLKECGEVWDYSRNNIHALKSYEIDARLVEVGYMPSMTRVKNFQKDTDILFFGSLNERRTHILQQLPGLKNSRALGVYGDEIYDLIDRSRIIVNCHYYDTGIHEIFRTSMVMANAGAVVSEVGKDRELEDRYKDAMYFCEYDEIPRVCEYVLSSPANREYMGREAFRIFSSRTQVDILKEVGVL